VPVRRYVNWWLIEKYRFIKQVFFNSNILVVELPSIFSTLLFLLEAEKEYFSNLILDSKKLLFHYFYLLPCFVFPLSFSISIFQFLLLPPPFLKRQKLQFKIDSGIHLKLGNSPGLLAQLPQPCHLWAEDSVM
jgi:hypothetical protein